MKPRYVLYAGANGSGKSTLYRINGNLNGLHYVNLDDEVRKLGDWRDTRNNLIAGKQVSNTIRHYLETGESFIQETTLCGNTDYAIERGYDVEIHYVAVENPEIAIERVHERMSKGGHGVADEDIKRRYTQSFQNLKKLLLKISRTTLYDNTYSFRKIAVYVNGMLVNCDNIIPEWYKKYF